MELLPIIKKTREYLDYVEEHILNVQKAFTEVKKACKNLPDINYMNFWNDLEKDVEEHDLSKLSENELVQYRRAFYPTKKEKKEKLDDGAWNHHLKNNFHHWETIMNTDYFYQRDRYKDLIHMTIDWTAMSYKFGGSAQEYYEKNKSKIDLDKSAIEFIYKIFDRLKHE